MPTDYLLSAIDSDYGYLKKQESEIISEAIGCLNKPGIEGIRATFKYNPERLLIGIYVGKEAEKLAIDDENLSKEEIEVVRRVHDSLEIRLKKLKLRRETWI